MRNRVVALSLFLLAFASACSQKNDSSSPAYSEASWSNQSKHHSISGIVSGATNVAVSLSGAGTASTTTDASGGYAFADLDDGSYTVTPTVDGYAFSPGSRSVTLDGADATGQDFVARWELDGNTWTYCHLEENFPQDELESLTFIGDMLYRTQMEYESTDSSCSGAAHGDVANAWGMAFTLGGEVQASLEGTTVTARALSLTGDQAIDALLFVDTAQNPDVLYIGQGSELWPRPYVQEPSSLVGAPALQGTWSSCNTAEAGDSAEVLTVHGYALSVAGASYPSNDGTCTGAPTPVLGDSAAFVLRGTATATLGDAAVTAREVDAVFGSGSVKYTILYLDTSLTPNVLYAGDEGADPARDGTAPDKRPLVLQVWKPRVKQP